MSPERFTKPEAAPRSPEEWSYQKTASFLEHVDLSHRRIALATDGEGPQFSGDTAAEAFNSMFHGTINGRSLGLTVFRNIGKWYDHEVVPYKPDAQIGMGVVLGLPLLVASGLTDEHLLHLAHRSQPVPGSQKWRELVRQEDGYSLCVTTAWEQPHRKLALSIGLDGLVGTEFSVNDARTTYMNTEQGQRELEQSATFMEDCIEILGSAPHGDDDENLSPLKERIDTFYREELGIGNGPAHASVTSSLLTRTFLMGNLAKAGAARALFDRVPSGALKLAIGDGTNDMHMLSKVVISVGVNGYEAALKANFGLITPDMGVMATLTEILLRHNPEHTRDFKRVIALANDTRAFKDAEAHVHPGGRLFGGALPEQLAIAHMNIRHQLRGEVGTALI